MNILVLFDCHIIHLNAIFFREFVFVWVVKLEQPNGNVYISKRNSAHFNSIHLNSVCTVQHCLTTYIKMPYAYMLVTFEAAICT